MKKTILFLVMALALTTQTLFAQVPSYVPTNGLVGYWPFNGNANDESGNGNNGTVNGSVQLTTDRFGISNSSYLFPGNSNSYISVPSSQTLKIQTEITISAWILMDGGYNNPRIIQFGNYVNSGYSLFVNGDSNVSRTLTGLITNVGGLGVGLSSELNSLVWNHVCFVANSNGSGKLYINGVIVSTVDGTVPNNVSYIGALNIGRMDHPAYDAWGGKLDDIGIWNRALTQQEITNIYNSSLPQTACLPANVPTTGLVGYWPFCGNANDESGNANNGTVNGATLTTDRFGNTNSAYNFDGINDNIGLGNFFNYTSFSISMWVKPGNQNGHAVIIDNNHASSNNWVFQTISNFSNNGYNFINSNEVLLSTNNWNHVILSYSLGVVRVYLNGNLVTETPWSLNYNNSPSLFLGYWQAANARFWKGDMDDIGIWNRALTQEEITNLYNVNQCVTNITVTDTLIINVGQLSFNDPVTWANNITIAPNPASSQININFNNITNLNGGTLKIINSLGQEVATTPITTSGTNSTMQLATWGGTGMYFVQIINPQGQIVDIKKIILQ
jgi:hypothetical protein